PPLCLLVERGNTDAWMFLLVLLALWLTLHARFAVRGAGYGVILLAACLKLYPAFALLSAIREGSRRRVAAVLGSTGAVFGLYLAATRSEVATILRVIPRPIERAYGREVLPRRIVTEVNHLHIASLTDAGVRPVGIGLVVLCVILGVSLARRMSLPESPPGGHDDERPFVAGAALFLGTLFVGHNLIYRLAVLLFCVPTLARWSLGADRLALLARVALGGAVVALWSSIYAPLLWLSPWRENVGLLVDQWAIWTVAVCLSALLAVVARARPGSIESRSRT
ncbi:MAG: glycosyltransferase 87 family protein, partial [Deltaproteobacteria bacterium]